jgi:hypothetical protein
MGNGVIPLSTAQQGSLLKDFASENGKLFMQYQDLKGEEIKTRDEPLSWPSKKPE